MSGTLPPMGSLAGIEPAPPGMVADGLPPLDPAILNAEIIPHPDGGVELVPREDDKPASPRDVAHGDNLAEALGDNELNRIAQDLLDGIDEDENSNSELWETLEQGMKLLGLKPGQRIDQRFKGASGVTHPLLKSALLRFHASASSELMPASGPVRCQVIGDGTPPQRAALESLSTRKQNWLNYYLTEVDEAYETDVDQGLLYCGLHGTMFRRVFRDPIAGGHPISRFLSVYDVLVNAAATSLTGGWRVTHIEPTTRGAMRRLQLAGYYRDIDLVEPTGDETPRKARTAQYTWQRPSQRIEDADHVVFCVRAELDIAGLEHEDDDGNPTGMLLPYRVWIDRDSEKVLRVERNWAENDTGYHWQNDLNVFRYVPGLGFYGWGLIHLAGDNTDALTVMWRQALDAYSFAAFPGGMRSKGARPEQSDVRVGPGEFHEIDTGGLPINQAVMSLPYRDVPASFPVLHESILSAGKEIASVAEINVGDGRQDAPVGTTITLIEQAQRIESGVIKRLHRAQRAELRALADLFGQAGADETYPYLVNGQKGQAIAQDFADNADVIPVVDPNAPTQTLRLARAQGKLTLARQFPGIIDTRAAIEDMLRTAGDNDADIQRLMPAPQSGNPADPVTEFAMLTKGMPLKASPEQDHAAHIQAHMGQMAAPGLMQSPQGQQLVAHIGEHLGMFYAGEAQRLTGIQIPPGQPMPPQVQNQIAGAVAAATNELRQSLTMLAPNAQPTGGKSPQELEIERLKLQFGERDSDRKAQETARQDAVTLIKLREDMKNDAAEREAKLRTEILGMISQAMQARQRQHETTATVMNDIAARAHDDQQAVLDAASQAHQHEHETHQAMLGVAETAIKAQADEKKADASVQVAKARPKPKSGKGR